MVLGIFRMPVLMLVVLCAAGVVVVAGAMRMHVGMLVRGVVGVVGMTVLVLGVGARRFTHLGLLISWALVIARTASPSWLTGR